MTVFQSIAISLGRNAEHGDFAAVAHVGEHVAEGRRVAGHFQADVEALLHAELLLHVGEACLSCGLTATVAPIFAASSRRYGFTSVMTT